MLPNLKEAVDRLECAILGKESYEIAGVSVSNLRVVLDAVKSDEDAEFVRMLADAKAAGVAVPAPTIGNPVAWRVTHYDGSMSYCRNKVSPCGGSEPDREVIPLYEAPVPAMTDGEILKLWDQSVNQAPLGQQHIWFARAILAALPQQAAPAIPVGWKLVPIEPTPEMISAVFAGQVEDQSAQGQASRRVAVAVSYSKMLAAAPQPPAPEGGK